MPLPVSSIHDISQTDDQTDLRRVRTEITTPSITFLGLHLLVDKPESVYVSWDVTEAG